MPAKWNNDHIRDLVIRTMVGEGARGDAQSMASVAHVLLNRAFSGHYGDPAVNGLTNTIKAPKQFSMWNSDIASSGKTISPNDPYYQWVGRIADAVVGGEVPDNTGGADHYYAPGGMPGGRAPPWAIGQTPTATIGGQHFYKLGLSASDATNFGHTSGGAIGAPAAAPSPAGGQFGPNDVYRNIPVKGEHGEDQIPMFLRWNPDPIGNDQKNFASLNPNIQRIIAQARTDNPNLSFVIGNGKRSAEDQDWAKSVGWSKVGSQDGGDAQTHMNGNAVDLWGLDKDGRVQMDPAQQAEISQAMKAAAAKLGVPVTWGGDWKGLKDAPHFEVQDGGAVAAGAEPPKYVAPLIPKSALPMGEGGGPTPFGIVREEPPNANAPAAQAQPVSATAPSGASLTPGAAARPSAGFTGPGSDKYSVISGMTTGTSHNPQLTTAANWGNLFGGAAPATATQPKPDTAQRVPLADTPQPPVRPDAPLPPERPAPPVDANHPLPWAAPQQGPPQPTPWEKATTDQNNPMPWPAAGPGRVPNWGPWHPGGSLTNPIINAPPSASAPPVLPSLSAHWGAATPNDPEDLSHKPWLNGAPASTPGGPSMGFPAQTNPFGAQQVSQLPGSMLSSAQNLIKMLFPPAG